MEQQPILKVDQFFNPTSHQQQNTQQHNQIDANHNNKDKKTYYLDASTFLTGVNQIEKGPKKLDDQMPKATEINMMHSQLNTYVNDLGLKISDVIKGHENDFFIAFKNKMYAIMKEMRELKEKASSERHKAKQETRLVNLEKERDWFRKEALKLDKICKDHKRILNKLKTTLENIEEDRDFFQEQLFNAKKVNKALLMELDKHKSLLMSTNQGVDALTKLQLQYSQPLAITNQERVKHTSSNIKRKLDAALAQDSHLDKFDQSNQLAEEDEEEDYQNPMNQDDLLPDYKLIVSPSSQQDIQGGNQLTTFEKKVQDSNSVSLEEYRKLVRENAELKEKECKYIDTIKHLKNQIDNEKKNTRTLRADKVNFMAQRNELEEFFLQCIEEVRKDIVKRKTITSSYSQKGGMKKSTSSASMARKISLQDQDTLMSNNNIKLENFTSTDKRKVIELLMSNENVLLFLYEKLFPATAISQQSTQSRGQTGYSQLHQHNQPSHYRFMTESGIPIQSTQNRSQTTFAGSRQTKIENNHLGLLMNQELGTAINGAISNSIPQTSTTLGANIQNNIQNINLNINLSKPGSFPFMEKNFRGSTAPTSNQRIKKIYQTQQQNKYAI